ELLVLANPNNKVQLLASYRGIGREEVIDAGALVVPEPIANWIVVRATAALEDNDYLRRRAVWDVGAHVGMQALFRVVESHCEKANIQVDASRCESSVPAMGSNCLPPDGGNPVIGEVKNEIPVWGGTDTHAHVVSNLTLGGPYVWGDPADPLPNI